MLPLVIGYFCIGYLFTFLHFRDGMRSLDERIRNETINNGPEVLLMFLWPVLLLVLFYDSLKEAIYPEFKRAIKSSIVAIYAVLEKSRWSNSGRK